MHCLSKKCKRNCHSSACRSAASHAKLTSRNVRAHKLRRKLRDRFWRCWQCRKLSLARALVHVHISLQALHFRNVKNRLRGRPALSQGLCGFRGRCSIFARSGTDSWQAPRKILWQAQHFRKIKYIDRSRRSAFRR